MAKEEEGRKPNNNRSQQGKITAIAVPPGDAWDTFRCCLHEPVHEPWVQLWPINSMWFCPLPFGPGSLWYMWTILLLCSSPTSAPISSYTCLCSFLFWILSAWFRETSQSCPPYCHGAYPGVVPQACLCSFSFFLCLTFYYYYYFFNLDPCWCCQRNLDTSPLWHQWLHIPLSYRWWRVAAWMNGCTGLCCLWQGQSQPLPGTASRLYKPI